MKAKKPPFRFPGAIHPHYHKDSTAALPLEVMPAPAVVAIPMSQHLGAPSKPIVAKGDVVGLGQPIAEPAAAVSAWAHASVSGVVKNITEGISAGGKPTTVIEIENDGQDRLASNLTPGLDWQATEPKALIAIVASAGIVGMGGAGFPTHIKINPPPGKKVETLILNGAECEPFLTADQRLMVEQADAIWQGIRILRHILGGPRIRVAIEDNKPEAIRAMEMALAQADGDVEIIALETAYPMGAEKQLVYSILGREIPAGGLPSDVGALVENVATAAAIHEAINLGRPLTQRVVTVTGPLIKRPANLLARIGTKFTDLIAHCGGFTGDAGKLICGGPMMGVAQVSADVPVGKTTSGILALPRQSVALYENSPCISCNRCVRACPMSLLPCTLTMAVEADQIPTVDRLNVLDCIECGCCAFVCPARRPMVQLLRQGKARVQLARRQEQERQKAQGKQG
ncbi:MAG: electron transport complex subunit RsxC [Kiritimatiellia bacterium]